MGREKREKGSLRPPSILQEKKERGGKKKETKDSYPSIPNNHLTFKSAVIFSMSEKEGKRGKKKDRASPRVLLLAGIRGKEN